MNYYKLEKVQQALESDYSARRISVGPDPRSEVWERSENGHKYHFALAWEHGEEIISEEELIAAADGLAINPAEELVQRVRDLGGLWLGPTPPSRKK